jgi:hypothetical protein
MLEMRNFYILAAVSLFLMAANPAPAQTAAEMLSSCETMAHARVDRSDQIHAAANFESGVCWGAFRTFQALSSLVIRGKKPITEICAPPQASLTQFVKIFYQYTRQHPESEHEDYQIIAMRALQSAFPCPVE